MNYPDVLDFWFNQLSADDWFSKNELLDLKMVEKFIVIHSQAVAGELFEWRADPLGRLAEIILIDQFSRNIYRDDPKAYSSDGMALALSQEAIRGNHHRELAPLYKQFLYMPFMHSESRAIQEISLKLFSEKGLEKNLPYALEHKKIIDLYGRYPERNIVLGRQNTPDEEYYLMTKETYQVQKDQTFQEFQRH